MLDYSALVATVIATCVLGFVVAIYYALETSKIEVLPAGVAPSSSGGKNSKLLVQEENGDSSSDSSSVQQKIFDISRAITLGAETFLRREYTFCAFFIVGFSIIIFVVLGVTKVTVTHAVGAQTKEHDWIAALMTAVAFIVGAVTSMICGYIGMKIAVYANSRTAMQAQLGYGPAFVTAFKSGAVMGFSLVAFGVLMLFVLINLFALKWTDAYDGNGLAAKHMYESIAGYGLGGSSIALFGRVGGGIYTKAADVGADLCGKLEYDLNEDDPKNPAVIADNVGDNVGDVAGMGADLFGSFAESTCAAMVVASQSGLVQLGNSESVKTALTFPLTITAAGIVVCLITSFFATHVWVVKEKRDIEASLKRQLLISTILMTPTAYALCVAFLPEEFALAGIDGHMVKNFKVFYCIACGLWSGLIIGYVTEYYTSNTYRPVREVADACETGAATNIIYGLALGYKSVIVPVVCLCLTIYTSYTIAHMFGIACAALGILSTLPIGLTIDVYGPICDNAGGIAEMAGMSPDVRDRTDALDAAGNTTAAIGKGFAIGSAALVSLALFGGFVTSREDVFNVAGTQVVNILQPFEFAGLLFGAMLPYWFSAMTMKSVGMAALEMVKEVRRQFDEDEGILLGTSEPDYAACVAISTDASLREMMYPGALTMFTPLIVGFLFGPKCLAGVLAGALVSGVQMAISASNTGGAWDNAKKYIESGMLGEGKGKGSDEHHAAVIGDTVGDPLKDTSGPSLNILIKLMAIISLVFASSFPTTGYIEQLFNK